MSPEEEEMPTICPYTDAVCRVDADCWHCELEQYNMVCFDGSHVRDDGIEISRGQTCAKADSMLKLVNVFYDKNSKVPKQYIDITLDNPIIDEMYPIYRWLIEQHDLGAPDMLMMAFKQPLLAQHGDTWYMVAPRYEH